MIENNLLPADCHFSDEQLSVIFENNAMDVVAGPGTGKTTVLTARIKILLEQLKDSGDGICVLTHTNVAVDEIKSSLKKLGVEEIKNPHFIGTIQDFFNTFFAKKAFHLILGDKQMRVLDDEIFREKFNKQFVRYYPFQIEKDRGKLDSQKLPNPAGKICEWNFLHEGNPVRVESKVGRNNKQYNKAFNTSIENLFKSGIITNHCCLELSKWYIEQYKEIFRAIISKRFAFLLLDEAQDTSKFQFELIQSLFDDSSVIFQKFGDPYQAIYNIWSADTELAWKVDASREKRISNTSRFSDSIVDVVKNVCIVKYDDFKSTNNHTSFSPYFIIYKDGNELIKKFSLLIDELEGKSETFKKSKRAKVIVSPQHRDLENTFGERYNRAATKNTNYKNDFDIFSRILLKSISKYFDIDYEDRLNKDGNRKKVFEIIKELKSNNDERIIDELNTLLNGLVIDEQLLENNLDLCIEIKEILKSNFSKSSQPISEQSVHNEGEDICIGTIHSVKGETHKATLLMLDSDFSTGYGDNSISYSMLQLLKKYLIKNYVELSKDKSDMEKETEKALKLAYVALSRLTHLVCIGISESKLKENETLIKDLKCAGWSKYSPSLSK